MIETPLLRIKRVVIPLDENTELFKYMEGVRVTDLEHKSWPNETTGHRKGFRIKSTKRQGKRKKRR